MEEREEQANHSYAKELPLGTKQESEKGAEHLQEPPPAIEYFIPPPINYLNAQYYQHLQGSENPMNHLTEKYVCFEQELPLNTTPPQIPSERPLSLSLKKQLRERNRDIYSVMRRILSSEARLSKQESVQMLQMELKVQLQKFLDICAGAKVAEIRYLTLKRIQAQTGSISQRSKAIKTELEEIKTQLSGQLPNGRGQE